MRKLFVAALVATGMAFLAQWLFSKMADITDESLDDLSEEDWADWYGEED